jgi:hypothetical protein
MPEHPAAADGDNDGAYVGMVLVQLKEHCALPGHHLHTAAEKSLQTLAYMTSHADGTAVIMCPAPLA